MKRPSGGSFITDDAKLATSGIILPALRNMPRIRGQDRDFVYLLLMAKKHNLTPSVLHASLRAARDRGRSRCGEFSIEMRKRGEHSSTYLFSVEGKPLSQADISDDSVEKLGKHTGDFDGFFSTTERRSSSKPDENGEESIRDLRYGLKGVSFKAVVAKKSPIRAVTSKDGNPLLVCSVTLSDGTGEIPLAVWNNQIAEISEGDLVEVRDARVRSFRGEIQLSLSRKTGRLTVLQNAAKRAVAIPSN
jgi:hypothetical protein